MKLSCITTCHDEGPLLQGCLRSILNQSYGNFQYIVVADGADRATRAVLAGIDDSRIEVVYQDNAGLSAARNAGLARVTGDYVCFLDADDSRPNWAFQAMHDAVQETRVDLLLCRGTLETATGALLPFFDTPQFQRLEARFGTGPLNAAEALPLAALVEPQSANKLLRVAFLREHGLEFPAPHYFEDIHFHIAALVHARRLALLHSPCFTYYRRYGRQQITDRRDAIRFDILPVVEKTLALFATRPAFADMAAKAAVLAACLKLIAWCEAGLDRPARRETFRQATRAMLARTPPACRAALAKAPDGLGPQIARARHYLAQLDQDQGRAS